MTDGTKKLVTEGTRKCFENWEWCVVGPRSATYRYVNRLERFQLSSLPNLLALDDMKETDIKLDNPCGGGERDIDDQVLSVLNHSFLFLPSSSWSLCSLAVIILIVVLHYSFQ